MFHYWDIQRYIWIFTDERFWFWLDQWRTNYLYHQFSRATCFRIVTRCSTLINDLDKILAVRSMDWVMQYFLFKTWRKTILHSFMIYESEKTKRCCVSVRPFQCRYWIPYNFCSAKRNSNIISRDHSRNLLQRSLIQSTYIVSCKFFPSFVVRVACIRLKCLFGSFEFCEVIFVLRDYSIKMSTTNIVD